MLGDRYYLNIRDFLSEVFIGDYDEFKNRLNEICYIEIEGDNLVIYPDYLLGGLHDLCCKSAEITMFLDEYKKELFEKENACVS